MTMPSKIWAWRDKFANDSGGWSDHELTDDDTPYIRADDRRALAEALGLVGEDGVPSAWLIKPLFDYEKSAGDMRKFIDAIIAGPPHD